MARISVYEASDGSLHRDRKDYLRHEANLVVLKKLQPLIEAQASSPEEALVVVDVLVKKIGLNTLRDLFAQKYTGEENEGDSDKSEAAAPAAPAAPAVADDAEI